MSADIGLVVYLSRAPGTFMKNWAPTVETKPRAFTRNYVEAVQDLTFSLHIGLKQHHGIKNHALGFHVLIDGEIVASQSYKASYLKTLWSRNEPAIIAHYSRDLTQLEVPAVQFKFGQPTYESKIELRIYRMMVPRGSGGGHLKKGEKKMVAPGEIIDRNGIRYVVNEKGNCITPAKYVDPEEDPFIVVEWRYMAREQLERILKAQRQPDSPDFKIIPKLTELISHDLDIHLDPSSPIFNMRLKEMDALAYAEFNTIAFEDLTNAEIKELARCHQCLFSTDHLTHQELEEYAKLQLDVEINAQIHLLTLESLIHVRKENISYLDAARKLWQGFRFVREDFLEERTFSKTFLLVEGNMQSMIGAKELSLDLLKDYSKEKIKEIYEFRYPDKDMASEPSEEEILNLVANHLVEEEYLYMKTQLVAVLAEQQFLKTRSKEIPAMEMRRAQDASEENIAAAVKMFRRAYIQSKRHTMGMLPGIGPDEDDTSDEEEPEESEESGDEVSDENGESENGDEKSTEEEEQESDEGNEADSEYEEEDEYIHSSDED